MDRREFIKLGTAAGLLGSCAYGLTDGNITASRVSGQTVHSLWPHGKTAEADVVIIGGDSVDAPQPWRRYETGSA